MSDRVRFPQIPSTVWWGVHALLNRSPKTVIDERLLGIEMDVQEAAAKQYIKELVSVGILDEEGRATPLALKWRLDATYPEAVNEVVSNVYPQSLRDVAPPGEGDRQKAVTWFLHEGYGQGAAKNKAATYFLLGSKSANEAPVKSVSVKTDDDTTLPLKRVPKVKVAGKQVSGRSSKSTGVRSGDDSATIPLNVNLQIHISADAGSEQIESIFAAMRRYLHDQQGN